MLLQLCSLSSIFQIDLLLDVCDTVTEQVEKSLLTKHGSEDSIGGSVNSLVGVILLQILDDNAVAVLQHNVLRLFGQLYNWVVTDKVFVLLSKYIKESLFLCCAAVERTLYWHSVIVVVFLIVGEYHQLCEVEETPEATPTHALVDALSLGKNALMVIGFLDLNKSQRKTIYKTGDVWAEVVVCLFVLAWKFCRDMPYIFVWLFRIIKRIKINEFDAAVCRQQLIEFPSEVIIVCNTDNLGE